MGVWAAGSTWTNIVTNSPEAGVYISANMFSHGSSFIGAQMLGFPLSDVSAVVAHNPPSSLHLAYLQNGTGAYNILPADLEGNPNLTGSTIPAPSGTDEYFMQFTGSNTLTLYQFKPDFTGGTGSTISSQTSIQVNNPFHGACGGGACVPQLGTSTQLDSLGDRLMYRLSYRNYGETTGQSMVVTHSVQNSSSSSQTGVRWYQLTATGATTTVGWGVGQEGTFGPSDGNYRWMGSIAQDKVGDLGIGYSVSGPTMYPGLAYTGRTSAEGSNLLESETLLPIGAGYQSSVNRWGDYSSMSVDPSNDCTMWYANEYLKSNGSYTNWGTRIINFKFPGCN
jgi:hypothetical protein